MRFNEGWPAPDASRPSRASWVPAPERRDVLRLSDHLARARVLGLSQPDASASMIRRVSATARLARKDRVRASNGVDG